MCRQYISKERVKTRLKRRYGWLYAIAFALILNLAVAGASRSYHLMEVRQDQTGKSVTLTSRIPRLSGLKDSSEQAKRNTEFQEESKKALVWTQMYRAKTGAQTASADQYYEVSFADENCLSIVFQLSLIHIWEGIVMSLGKNLFQARKQNGFSQEDIAEKLGISRQTVSKWETDESLPDIQQAKDVYKRQG